MTPNEFNNFLKVRRTRKLFDDQHRLTLEEKQLVIDAANYSPAQNSQRNFIPMYVDSKNDLLWLMKNIFYMVPTADLNKKEYMMSLLTASASIVYLEANSNLPIAQDYAQSLIVEPTDGLLHIRNINMGLSMGFVACQSYLMGYDVGFVGCCRGITNVMNNDLLSKQLYNLYQSYGIDTAMAKKFGLAPSYAVAIGKGLDFNQYPNPNNSTDPSILWQDGCYTNMVKHKLNPIENVKLKNEKIQ